MNSGSTIQAFFDSLAKLVSTRPYTQPNRTDYEQRKTPKSGLSHSSEEDKAEMGTIVCCFKDVELGF